MLSTEDYPNKINLTAQQLFFAEQHDRKGCADIRSGHRRRNLLSFALLPVDVLVSSKKRVRGEPTNLKASFVRGNEVGVVTLSDHPAMFPKRFHQIETRALVNVGRIDETGAPRIGGLAPLCKLRVDFSKAPLNRSQASSTINLGGSDTAPVTVRAPFAGLLQVSRCSKWVDFSIGTYGYGAADSRPCLVARVEVHDMCNPANKPKIATDFDLPVIPQPGETIVIGEVTEGQALFSAYAQTKYFTALFANKKDPVVQWPPGRTLPANRVEVFGVLNEMLKLQNDTALSSRPSENMVGSDTWAFGVFIAFERKTVKCATTGTLITVDPNNLTDLPDFDYTQALCEDLIKALGPTGSFHLTAAFKGEIASIEQHQANDHLTQITFVDGQTQLVPATALLWQVIDNKCVELQPGSVINNVGDVIGDFAPRVRYQWAALAGVLGDNLFWVIEQFLSQTAIHTGQEGWTGSEVLYDHRYVTSVVDFAARSETFEEPPGQGDKQEKERVRVLRTRFCYDLRKTHAFYDAALNATVLPPVRYDDWENHQMLVNGLEVDLSDPFLRKKPVEVLQVAEETLIS